jgi:hypothetical protein
VYSFFRIPFLSLLLKHLATPLFIILVIESLTRYAQLVLQNPFILSTVSSKRHTCPSSQIHYIVLSLHYTAIPLKGKRYTKHTFNCQHIKKHIHPSIATQTQNSRNEMLPNQTRWIRFRQAPCFSIFACHAVAVHICPWESERVDVTHVASRV